MFACIHDSIGVSHAGLGAGFLDDVDSHIVAVNVKALRV